jgi:aminopeptidase YwaD
MRFMTTSRARFVLIALASVAAGHRAAATAPPPQMVVSETIDAESVRAAGPLDRLLPKQAETIYRALATRFQPARAMEIVTFMDRYWRLAGNTGFDASIERLKSGLAEAGFEGGRADATPGAARGPRLWVEEYPNGGNGWELVRAEMTIVEAASGKTPEPVFDPVVDYIALGINSFSTPAEGVTTPLVYVGSGTDAASYGTADVKGAVVLADGSMRAVWAQAVRQRGAVGVISVAQPPSYTRPDVTPEVFQWGSVPYDEASKAFGFTASRRVAERLKERLRAGPVRVKTQVETRCHLASPGRLLVAEIPGRVRPEEHVVLVAHIQEPGANDNASGCGTLYEMARALAAAVAAKTIPPPARTITFIWGDEMRAGREWLRADAARPKNTRYMIALDMTGEDASKTGGSFLIEKEPDPSAVWPRPSDPHTEWSGGRSSSKADTLKGSLLNDLTLAVCLRRARDTRWNVQTNPYEGGSDHSSFLQAGVPALLAWHSTDRYYHTNLDRPDKTSPAEMANVGIAVGTTVTLLASAGQDEATAVADLVATAAGRRLALEAKQSAAILDKAPDRAAAEQTIIEAWKKWYGRALESVLTLPAEPAGEKLQARVRAAIEQLNGGTVK